MPIVASSGAYRSIATPAMPQPGTGASGYLFSAPARLCPECGDVPRQIPRRGVDHVLSFFVSPRRFRCPNLLCQWEGDLRP
jgi:hypothetical protein